MRDLYPDIPYSQIHLRSPLLTTDLELDRRLRARTSPRGRWLRRIVPGHRHA